MNSNLNDIARIETIFSEDIVMETLLPLNLIWMVG